MTPRIGLARKHARKILKDFSITSPPIILAPIIKTLKFRVKPHNLDENLSGIQITLSNDCYILYRKSDSIHRKRFTIAHEIGHFILNHTSHEPGGLDLLSTDVKEVEANQFAAELLMPLAFMKTEIEISSKPSELALKFWVSKVAMDWRLRETKLYEKLLSWQ